MTELYPFNLMAKPAGPQCNLNCDYCFYLSKQELLFNNLQDKKKNADNKNHADYKMLADRINRTGDKNRADKKTVNKKTAQPLPVSSFAMNYEVLEAYIKGYIEAQPEGTKEITFSWQGGEPSLLPVSFFEKALELQKKYSRRGMNIFNTFQTNGTLLSAELAGWLKNHNFLVGISIDGPERLHNLFRKDKTGAGSFNAVMKGIDNLVAAGTDFNTLTCIQSDNCRYPEEIYDFLKSIGSKFIQFIPIVETLSGKPGVVSDVSSRTVGPQEWGSFLIGVFNKWIKNDIGRIFIQHFDSALSVYAGYISPMCVFSETCGNAMAIEHEGSIYSCDHYVFPDYYLGNVTEKPLEEIVFSEKQLQFGQAKKNKLPDKCLNCSFLNLCRGGCPKNRIVHTDSGSINWLCEGYYNFFDYTSAHFKAMNSALRNRLPASDFRRFFIVDSRKRPGRNNLCPCGSGLKFKDCHGALPSV